MKRLQLLSLVAWIWTAPAPATPAAGAGAPPPTYRCPAGDRVVSATVCEDDRHYRYVIYNGALYWQTAGLDGMNAVRNLDGSEPRVYFDRELNPVTGLDCVATQPPYTRYRHGQSYVFSQGGYNVTEECNNGRFYVVAPPPPPPQVTAPVVRVPVDPAPGYCDPGLIRLGLDECYDHDGPPLDPNEPIFPFGG